MPSTYRPQYIGTSPAGVEYIARKPGDEAKLRERLRLQWERYFARNGNARAAYRTKAHPYGVAALRRALIAERILERVATRRPDLDRYIRVARATVNLCWDIRRGGPCAAEQESAARTAIRYAWQLRGVGAPGA